MRHTRWFGKIIKVKNKEPEEQNIAQQIGLYRVYQGKKYLLPLGELITSHVRKIMEEDLGDTLALMLPPRGGRLDWAVLLAGEIKSYTELPVWIRLKDGRGWFEEQTEKESEALNLTSRYLCVEENQIVEKADKWRSTVEKLFSTLGFEKTKFSENGKDFEYFMEDEHGNSTRLCCYECGWLGSRNVHPVNLESEADESNTVDPELSISKIETPGIKTIRDLADFFNTDPNTTIKSVFLESDEGVFIQALIRGDREVSRKKVEWKLGVQGVRAASAESVQRVGAPAGYAGPVMNDDFFPNKTIVDSSISESRNYIAGANKEGWHVRGVRPGRDFKIHLRGDISQAKEGGRCSFCGGILQKKRGRVLASWRVWQNLFSLSGSDSKRKQIGAGIGTLNTGQIMEVLIRRGSGDKSMHWPGGISPFNVYMISIREEELAEKIYRDLESAGVTIFYDDRKVSPGIKFKDADLMGCPFRLTVSSRSIKNGGIEVYDVNNNDEEIISVEEIVSWITTRV